METLVMTTKKGRLRPYATLELAEGNGNFLPLPGEEPEQNRDVEDQFGWRDNRGVGVVELILILVVLIALVAIFKTQLTNLVNTIFGTISKNAGTVMK